jgi:4-aminobutyrate aminotransferase
MPPSLNLPGPKAKAIVERDKMVISPSYPRDYPFVMDKGKGVEVWDVDGNRFIDFAAGIAVAATGHSHPKVVNSIQEQAEKFIHISSDFYHQKWVELGEKFNEVAPFQEAAVSFMTNSGTESVEAAIKLARFQTGRTQFIGFLGGFHGRTMGSLAFTASKPRYHQGFYPLMSGVTHVPFPDPYRPLLQSQPNEYYGETVVRYIEEQLFEKVLPAQDVAGVLVETVQGEGGYVFPAPGFFSALRELCDRHEILLIVDEVQSGMGRTGKFWAIEHYHIEPDIVCVGKGVASGVPLGAIIARRSLMSWPKGSHGNTFGGNPLACAAALATIDLIERDYLRNAVEVGGFALERLEEIKFRHPSIGDVRGMGLMIGVEFVKNEAAKEPNPEIRDQIIHNAYHRGLLTLGCGKSAIRVAPPLLISKDEMEEGLIIFEEAVTHAERESLTANVT